MCVVTTTRGGASKRVLVTVPTSVGPVRRVAVKCQRVLESVCSERKVPRKCRVKYRKCYSAVGWLSSECQRVSADAGWLSSECQACKRVWLEGADRARGRAECTASPHDQPTSTLSHRNTYNPSPCGPIVLRAKPHVLKCTHRDQLPRCPHQALSPAPCRAAPSRLRRRARGLGWLGAARV